MNVFICVLPQMNWPTKFTAHFAFSYCLKCKNATMHGQFLVNGYPYTSKSFTKWSNEHNLDISL